jgi:hypothetical protein
MRSSTFRFTPALLLLLVPVACGDAGAGSETGDAGTTAVTAGVTDGALPTTGMTGPGGTTSTSTSTDATTTTGSVDPSASSSTGPGGTTMDAQTTGTSTDATTGDPPPAAMPDLVCPGDPNGACDPVDDAPLFAGVSVLSIVPDCFEAWIDKDKDNQYDLFGDQVLDCGCDRLCPGDPGYPKKDAGEGNLTLQASWIGGFQTGRAAQGVRGEGVGLPGVGAGDGISARALVLEQGNTTLALVTVDLVGYFNDDVLAVRELLAAQGLAVDYVLVHAIHNHEGPDTMGLWGPFTGISGYDDDYRAQVRAAIVEAIVAADGAKQPVEEIVVGEVDVSDYHANGVANVINDLRDPFVIDEALGAARLVGAQDQTIASLVSFGNHPETVGADNNLLSADFVHALRRTLEQGSTWTRAPGKPGLAGPCLFINAAVGGMMTPLGAEVVTPDGDAYTAESFAKADSVGQLLGEIALDAIDNGDVVLAPRLDLQAQRFKLRVDNSQFNLMFELGIFKREIFEEMGAKFLETEMVLINLGPIQLLSVPGELLPELAIGGYDGSHINAPGKALLDPNNPNPPDLAQAPDGPYLKDKMHGTYRWIVGMGNDELGYIIPAYDFVLGDPPWTSEAAGDHYEETNSLGVETFAGVDATADLLLAWSKWVHDL